ncbi:hypothetical protein TVAG_454550 [Trichomonas vaginalis G3]|uniref:DUF3447 domain-containing protein n=1 Tax=Trichomonas vaginalis (strain ATCC PRA-98 / G3) TaxID=412133 RepID=A2EU68_TRIV3|nr:protein of unknown function (DUF3447) [Trichomonas vaginalis G3]EAY03816.1 hypothetical protein TVAG_454550 [Trichomonas vaginalis G3]KAI5552663.1 protein of unknown function (DUF3447) [Trichomonas vaginalis G3]|eukprot:XP_001316039.1 hypothetical protein [Trichomonas vaginalis G3]
MSGKDIQSNKYSELRSTHKDYIDSYIALYRLKTEKEEELNSIYKMIRSALIDSKKHLPKNIIRDILNIIQYNNRYAKSYLYLAKRISDDYNVKQVSSIPPISNFLFYNEYGITLDKSENVENINKRDLDIYSEKTIYKAIMDNDKERFIQFIESGNHYKDQRLNNILYPETYKGYSLLELCCYHGSVDCFKLLRTNFKSEITQTCLEFSFLGRNQEIMSECLKYQKPDKKCMEYAIISHNIDFVTFLMNEHNFEIDLYSCGIHKNLESFLVYFDQTNDFNKCFVYSAIFGIASLCEYFLLHGAKINYKDDYGLTALHYAAKHNNKETMELLISRRAKINETDKDKKPLFIMQQNLIAKKQQNFLFHMVQKSMKKIDMVKPLFIMQQNIIAKKQQNFLFHMV